MTLPTSGPLTFTDIQTEFGGSNPIGLNEYYAGGSYVASGTTGTYGAVPSSGQIGVQNFYGTSAVIPVYIEDVFSTYLYAGDGTSTKTITNNIDLSTEGGMVWIKCRNNAYNNYLFDTERGATKYLISNATNATATSATSLKSFTTTGYTLGSLANVNSGSYKFSSWSFRQQPKFFDVVTYTGNGVAGRQIPHDLGSAPGCIILKCVSAAGEPWYVYHRSIGATKYMLLNSTGGETTSDEPWYNTEPTSTNFTVAQYNSANGSGKTYVAYLFAHNAGGFGTTGTDNVISCGSYTGNGGTNAITLGYEPQWILVRAMDNGYDWAVYDNMRGMPTAAGNLSNSLRLVPNTDGEEAGNCTLYPTATGFTIDDASSSVNGSGINYIYIAIRRGPMKVPTDATKVFLPFAGNDTSPITTGFPVDMTLDANRIGNAANTANSARLTGTKYLSTASTAAETYVACAFDSNTTVTPNVFGTTNPVVWAFQRTPSFFDVVCYTGNGTAGRTITHNLGAVPELMIVKSRSGPSVLSWMVYTAGTGNQYYMQMNDANRAYANAGLWNDTSPTSSVFTVGDNYNVNGPSSYTYIAYLFATCAGVSKVGSYTGTGTTKQVDCGFAAGARFVMIKRTDTSGGWYVWDSARGIVAGNDPYIFLNNVDAQVTNTDYVDTYSAGFEISSTAPDGINASGGTYIFLAIA